MVGGEGNRLVPGLVGASIGGAAGLGAGFLLKHILGKKRQKKVGSIGFSAVSVSPGMLLAVPQAASNALMLGSRATGAAAGALDAPSADDEHEAQLEATRDLLRQRLAQAKALKAETTLRQLLAKRKR
jgi:enoyl-CoA hydratase/carnithine racemase